MSFDKNQLNLSYCFLLTWPQRNSMPNICKKNCNNFSELGMVCDFLLLTKEMLIQSWRMQTLICCIFNQF